MPSSRSTTGCPMESLLRTQGPRRFGVLKRQVPGISAKILTDRLRFLESTHLVTREYACTIPPQVT